MSNLAALGLALATLLIAAAFGSLAWALTGSYVEGWIVLVLALNPVWLVLAWLLDPRQIRWR